MATPVSLSLRTSATVDSKAGTPPWIDAVSVTTPSRSKMTASCNRGSIVTVAFIGRFPFVENGLHAYCSHTHRLISDLEEPFHICLSTRHRSGSHHHRRTGRDPETNRIAKRPLSAQPDRDCGNHRVSCADPADRAHRNGTESQAFSWCGEQCALGAE